MTKNAPLLKFEKRKSYDPLPKLNAIYKKVLEDEKVTYSDLSSLLYYAYENQLKMDIGLIEKRYFQKEIDDGDYQLCCLYLAGVYLSGLIVPQDGEKVIKYLNIAFKCEACFDSASAMQYSCYCNGIGVEKDPKKGIKLLNKARKKLAKQKHDYIVCSATVKNIVDK